MNTEDDSSGSPGAHGSTGDAEVADLRGLLAEDYQWILDRARQLMGYERKDHTFGSTGSALANEITLRLLTSSKYATLAADERLAHATTIARHVLVDYARRRRAEKRSADRREEMPLEITGPDGREGGLDVIALHECLIRLATEMPRVERVLHYKYFGGLSLREIGVIIGISKSSAQVDFNLGHKWLKSCLS